MHLAKPLNQTYMWPRTSGALESELHPERRILDPRFWVLGLDPGTKCRILILADLEQGYEVQTLPEPRPPQCLPGGAAGIQARLDSGHHSQLCLHQMENFLELYNLGEVVWGLSGSDNFLEILYLGSRLGLGLALLSCPQLGPGANLLPRWQIPRKLSGPYNPKKFTFGARKKFRIVLSVQASQNTC